MLQCFLRRRLRAPALSRFAQLHVNIDIEAIKRQLQHFSSFASPPAESIAVPCQSNGNVTLDIHHPLLGPGSSPTVLLYLPRGPSILPHDDASDAEDDASTVSILQSLLPYHVVQLNYRWSQTKQFPTPIHDVLAGYDWVLEHLLPKRAVLRPGRADHLGGVAVCGESIGGGLATMLALTECRLGQAGVVAAGVSNPVVDWVGLDEGEKSSSLGTCGSATSASPGERLLQLRNQLFRKPEQYFDPFASPLLFFRSAGAEIPDPPPPPPPVPPQDDLDFLAMLDRENFHRQQLALISASSTSAFESPSPPPSRMKITKRKASRRFPSTSSGLRLPLFNVSAGRTLPVKDQAAELVFRLRQSFARQAKGSSGRKVLMEDEMEYPDEDERKVEAQLEAELERKASFALHDGTGLWDGSPHGRARVREVAGWLKESLG